MDHQKLKVLLLDDEQKNSWSISNILQKQNIEFELTLVNTEEGFLKVLRATPPSIILSDYCLTTFNSGKALNVLKESGLNIPFVIVTDRVNEAVSGLILKDGADDYILKDRLERLPIAVFKAIQKNKTERLLQEAELEIKKLKEMSASIIQYSPTNIAAMGVVSNVTNQIKNELELFEAKVNVEKHEAKLIEAQSAGKIGNWETSLSDYSVVWSLETYKIFELDSSKYHPNHESFLTFVHPDDKTMVHNAFINSLNTKGYNFIEHRIITSKGTLKHVEERWKIIYDEQGLPISTFGTCQDITERKIVEQEFINTKEKAEENECRLKLATESAKLGIWDWEIREHRLTWDNTMFAIFGIEDKINANIFECWLNSIHPNDKERVLEEVNFALKGERDFDTSFRIVKPNGTIAYIKADGVVLCDMVGNSARMIGINRDITEQRLAEKSLQNSKNRLIKILQNSPIASCLATLDHSVVFYNNQFTNLFGYTIQDIPNVAQWWILAYPDEHYRESVKNEWLTRIELAQTTQTKFVKMDAKVCCKDGSYRFIEFYYANMDEEYLVNFNDITERIKYEEQLALSSLIINSIDDAIISKSLDGKVTSWNRAAERLLGYGANEIIGNSTDVLKSSEIIEKEEKEIIAKIEKGETVYRYETKRTRKDGEQIDVSLTVSSILDAQGKMTGLSKILRDITYQKRIELEREKTLHNLVQRNNDLEQFSFIISHNLRGPVATILGLINLMNDLSLNDDEKKKIMLGLSNSVNNLDSVIKDLSCILQIKAHSNEKKQLIQFSDLIDEVGLSLNDLIRNENAKILSNFDAVNEIVTIKSYMYSVFYNLISNSIKYHKPDVHPIIEITSEILGNHLILKFKDNSVGIDLAKHGKDIFGLNKRFSFNVEGNGLGLFMVKTQLESIGGQISIKSEVNNGCVFTITFENYSNNPMCVLK